MTNTLYGHDNSRFESYGHDMLEAAVLDYLTQHPAGETHAMIAAGLAKQGISSRRGELFKVLGNLVVEKRVVRHECKPLARYALVPANAPHPSPEATS